MSLFIPKLDTNTESRLLSPRVTTNTGSCLSFLTYFKIDQVSLTIGLANVSSYNFSTYDVIKLAVLQHPLPSYMVRKGESSNLLRLRLPLPAGSYQVLFIAEGNDGIIHIWDIQQSSKICDTSRKI